MPPPGFSQDSQDARTYARTDGCHDDQQGGASRIGGIGGRRHAHVKNKSVRNKRDEAHPQGYGTRCIHDWEQSKRNTYNKESKKSLGHGDVR